MAGEPGEGSALPQCEREAEVVCALVGGELSADLLQHAEACGVCSEVRTITRQLHAMDSSVEEPMESAAGLWWRLNLRMRREKLERAGLPLIWMGRICAATVVLVACFALWQVSARIAADYVLIVDLSALAAVALPTMIVLWRWSQS
jgi:hypothetical protein